MSLCEILLLRHVRKWPCTSTCVQQPHRNTAATFVWFIFITVFFSRLISDNYRYEQLHTPQGIKNAYLLSCCSRFSPSSLGIFVAIYARILFYVFYVFLLLNRSYRRRQIFVVSLRPFASLFDHEVLVENSLLIVDYDFVEFISRERYNTDRSVEETEGRAQRDAQSPAYRTKHKKRRMEQTALVHSLKFICFSFILIWPELYIIENIEYLQNSYDKEIFCI